MGFFDTISLRYGQRTVLLMKRWAHINIKLANLRNRKIFLLQHRRMGLHPGYVENSIINITHLFGQEQSGRTGRRIQGFTNRYSILIFGVQILVAFVTVSIAYLLWSYQYWKKKNVPYIPPMLPFGSMKSPFRRKKNIGDEVADSYNIAKERGWKYLGMYSMATPIFLPIDLELTKLIMGRDFHHFVDRGMYYNEKDEPIGAHLFAIGGNKWKRLRTKLTPTFTSGKMKGMFPTLVSCGHTLESFLKKDIQNGDPVDIKSVLARYSTDIIGSCAFGIECNSFENPNSPFIQYGRRIFQMTMLQSLKNVFCINFPNFARFVGLRAMSKEISDFYFKVVGDTVNYRRQNNVKRPDFLQLLIDIIQEDKETEATGDGTKITFDEAVAQCFVFFIAGFETSSTTMTFALFMLAQHGDIQEKVRQEIKEVIGKHNGEITYESLSEMKYLGQVIDETLRMFPPVPIITRLCVEDWQIPDTDIVIEKNTRIFIPVTAYHYDRDNFPNPEVFDPDRFTEDNRTSIHQFAHIPFGEGPRLCIGMRFGLMQTKVGLISVLKNFKVTLNKKTKLPLQLDKYSFIPTAEGGIWLSLEELKS